MEFDLGVVGTSWGGLTALGRLVSGLPADFAMPLVLVQHRGRDGESILERLLQEQTSLAVCEVFDKQPVEPGHIYLAPADYHLLVERGHLALTTDAATRHSRPSIDVTFESAADSYRERLIGVVLTGANEDGSRGLRRVADRGGFALVQDPATAEAPTMPAAAMRAVPSARVVPLTDIASQLVALSRGGATTPGGAT
ncbi:MAG: chemotaxis protein CheB [Gemmatimonadota bacterium]|nr:chemotaxis protein CheB [Gemmatimonadota bacterium]